jgi:hypothetical protein
VVRLRVLANQVTSLGPVAAADSSLLEQTLRRDLEAIDRRENAIRRQLNLNSGAAASEGGGDGSAAGAYTRPLSAQSEPFLTHNAP